MTSDPLHDAITGQWNYAELPSNVKVGKDCYLERRDSFKRYRSKQPIGLTLGDNVKAYTWTEFNIEPTGSVSVGENTTLVGVVLMCAERIEIGRRVTISYNVTIADSDFHPRDPALRKQDAIANAPDGDQQQRPPVVCRPVIIEDDVWIGIGAIILKGVRIGRAARIGAGSVVTSDVPPGAEVSGNPARIISPA
jgi:acetyltransferase-like isoleucine patch superfamily enzyme